MHQDLIAEDVQWFDSLIQGDRKAFEAIYLKYHQPLFAYARNKISNTEDCRELVQEVFESLWSRHDKLQNEGLRFYLFRMMKFKVIRYFKHEKVKRKYSEHYTLFEAVYHQWQDEESGVDPIALQSWLNKNLSQLPDRCQQVFRFRLNHNLSNAEIAERMNIQKTTVERYMISAVAHLRSSCQHLYKAMTLLLTAWWAC